MKKFTLIILMVFVCALLNAQTISQAHFRISNKSKGFRSIDLLINDTFWIGLSGEGTIRYIESDKGETLSRFQLESPGYPNSFLRSV